MLVSEKKGGLTVRKRRMQGKDEFGVHILDLQKWSIPTSQNHIFYNLESEIRCKGTTFLLVAYICRRICGESRTHSQNIFRFL